MVTLFANEQVHRCLNIGWNLTLDIEPVHVAEFMDFTSAQHCESGTIYLFGSYDSW